MKKLTKPFLRRGLWALGLFFFLPFAEAGDNMSIGWIQERIHQKHITSLEQLLPELPFSYRSNFTLVYSSHSQQEASFLQPRVIMYGVDAQLILAFNSGDPHQRGSDSIEAIQFNPNQAKFEFYEIKREGTGTLGVRTGASCVACHQQDSRPNWQPYAQWPGLYGSDDDGFARHSEHRVPGEMEHLQAFFQVANQNPRYRTLEGLADLDLSPDSDLIQVNHDRNISLSKDLWILNAQRLTRKIRAFPDYRRYRFALLGSIACAPRFVEFFPGDQRPQGSFTSFFQGYQGHESPNARDKSRSAGAYLFDKVMRLPWEDFPMASGFVNSEFLEGSPFNDATGSASAYHLAADLAEKDPELAIYVNIVDRTSRAVSRREVVDADCDKLAAASRASIAR